MKDPVLIFKKQLCTELGISKSTLYRWMKKAGLPTDRGLFTQEEAEKLKIDILASRKILKMNQNEPK